MPLYHFEGQFTARKDILNMHEAGKAFAAAGDSVFALVPITDTEFAKCGGDLGKFCITNTSLKVEGSLESTSVVHRKKFPVILGKLYLKHAKIPEVLEKLGG